MLWWLGGKSAKQGFWWGYLTGVVINTGGYYWITGLIITFGHLPVYIAVLGMVLHSLLVGLIWGLWGLIVCALSPRWGRALIVPLAMMGAEYAMPRIFEAHMGDSQFPAVIVMQIADLFGITAVTGLIYLVNASIVDALERRFKSLTISLLLVGLALGYGSMRMEQIDEQMKAAPKLKVGMVEGDVGIFQSEPRQQISDHLLIQQRLSAELAAQGAELIVWPESAVRTRGGSASGERKSFYVSTIPLVDRYQEDRLQKTPHKDRITPLRGFQVPLLFGGHGVEENHRADPDSDVTQPRNLHYNRAWLVNANGEVLGYYDKVFRLVFGEYIPFGDMFPVFYKWIPSAARIEPGDGPKSLELPREGAPAARLGILNCYEGIIPSYTLKVLETQPDVLINLTNDDWFQSVAERYLHFVLALPRSIESRRMYLRATLTGVSAVVDANGRVVRQTGLNSKLKGPEGKGAETILYDVPLMRSWTLYSEIGDLLPRLSILFLIFAELMRRGERAREEWLEESARGQV